MTLREWADRIIGGRILSVSVTAHLDPVTDTLMPLEISLKTDQPIEDGALVLGEDGESLKWENRVSVEADLAEAGRIVIREHIPDISAAIFGKPIQEVTLFDSECVTIGLSLKVNDGSQVNIFNNGDKFMLSSSPDLRFPVGEKLRRTIFGSDNPQL